MYSIGIDIGGTFTDCVLVHPDGHHSYAKALSTKVDPVPGVLAGLRGLGEAEGLGLEALLAGTGRLGHGTTIGTNAVLERRGARVGLVTTAGHGDALAIMRGHGRVAGLPPEEVFRVRATAPPAPLVVDGAVLEVVERVDSTGKVVVALDEQRISAQAAAFVDRYRLDSVAVALLWSFANPAHERAIAEAIRAVRPGTFVSLSAEVSPRLGEYERIVATVLDAYIGPACTTYLRAMSDQFAADGLTVPLMVMQSNGGVVPASAAAQVAIGTLHSGPAGGLTGAAVLAGQLGHRNVVATDMGGTSFDIGLIVDGEAIVEDEAVIDHYTYRLPHLDVRTVACGGGTIAHIDIQTGGLRVGPHSAGADPGPACYGRGGTEPTVTDADLVLGLLPADSFLSGRMPLDLPAATEAVARLADRLGLSVEQTAAGIVNVNNLRAATLVRQQTVERGLDPRDFVVYAYGGAGPVHAFGYAAEVGAADVVIPLGNGASTLSAFGISAGDQLRYVELETSLVAPFDGDMLATALTAVRRRAQDALSASGVRDTAQIDVWALMRFREQLMHALEVAVQPGEDVGGRLLADYLAAYGRRYGASATALFNAVEVFALRARARVPASIAAGAERTAAATQPALVREVEVYWPHVGVRLRTPVHDGTALADGASVRGPGLVQLPHTTIAVPQGGELTSLAGHFRLRLPQTDSPLQTGRTA